MLIPFTALLSGLVFGLGLILSGMTDPAKVLSFLDVAGLWDPSLMFVMLGAISIGFFCLQSSKTARPNAAVHTGSSARNPHRRSSPDPGQSVVRYGMGAGWHLSWSRVGSGSIGSYWRYRIHGRHAAGHVHFRSAGKTPSVRFECKLSTTGKY